MLIIKLKFIAFSLILTFMLSSCGPTIPRSELHDLSPLMEVVNLNLNDKQLKLRITHRNKRVREANQLSCQLAIKDNAPVRFKRIQLPDLTHYAKETISIQLEPNSLIKINKNIKELPYVLDCFLYSENFRDEQIIKKANLYKVPGTISEYR